MDYKTLNLISKKTFSALHYPFSIIDVQEKETINSNDFTDVFRVPKTGRLLALDLGMKHIGVAVSDELQFTVSPVSVIERKSWKKVLKQVISFLEEFDAVGLVLGLPYNTDGSESEMSLEARRLARNFSLSISVPVILQDERLTSYEAKGYLKKLGLSEKEIWDRVDSEAAAIILSDFLNLRSEMLKQDRQNLQDKNNKNLIL
ncbi:MAG TPA: Holliday junction resolvase RuvX [Pyrinomonadaceae bacterium]|nr:Holliday junction resolvase RuvX [Pyrinomonadaceae bacterium]